MTTVVVLQARMGSTRLPGKVLRDLAGRPMLVLMLERLGPLVGHGVDELVVATSDGPGDDAIAAASRRAGVSVVRGPEADVLARFDQALADHPADTVVRLTADCPLIDPALVGQALDLHRRREAAYTSNTLIRTYPDGLDVEVIEAAALGAAAVEATDPVEREHVTPFVYRRPGRFQLAALRNPDPLGDERWTVDTADDLADLDEVVSRLADPTRATWREVLAVAGRRRPPTPGQLWLRPLEPADEPALVQAGRAAPHDVTADPGDPSVRAWAAEVDGEIVGWLAVTIDDGVGTVSSSVPSGRPAAARAGLAAQLGADRQVVTLVDPA